MRSVNGGVVRRTTSHFNSAFRIPHSALNQSAGTPTCAGSTRTAQHLSSAILAYGSSTGLVSRFAAASRKWNGTNTWPRATRSERRHEITRELRRDVTRARSPSSSPSAAASAGGRKSTTTRTQFITFFGFRLLLAKKKKK